MLNSFSLGYTNYYILQSGASTKKDFACKEIVYSLLQVAKVSLLPYYISAAYLVADWYLFFGAGESMAQMAAAGETYPTIVTLIIAVVLLFGGFMHFRAQA